MPPPSPETASPRDAAVVVIGGGVIGSSIALHLRQRLRDARVIVVERDPTYARASSRLATGGVRQQYDSPLNVAMARHSVAYYACFDELALAAGHRARAWFRQRGYLFLADAARAEHLARRLEVQRASGANVERWTREQIRARVPGLVADDIALGVFGPEDGYLDPREVLRGFCAMAELAGAEYLHGEVVEVERRGGRVSGMIVRTPDGDRRLDAPVVVNAAGAYAAEVGRMAGVSLPIAPVRQHLFRLELAVPLPSRIPMIFDPDGTHWRLDDPHTPNEHDRLVIGRSRDDEPVGENLVCDHGRLERELLPVLERRYPAARVRSVVEGWAGLYEMTPDQNALLGAHPTLPGFVVAAGFSGHGLMMAPATGLAVAELIAEGRCATFDIDVLAVGRFETGALYANGAMI
ncbi:MAG: FAD-binding oxidoreductase [Gemmatimonadota bacterium]|nr:FAD-binding oxidoreductase [Gemmatimonadota bacterium]